MSHPRAQTSELSDGFPPPPASSSGGSRRLFSSEGAGGGLRLARLALLRPNIPSMEAERDFFSTTLARSNSRFLTHVKTLVKYF